MRKKIITCILLTIFPALMFAGIKPVRLTCEYLIDPMAIDIPEPRLSWINNSGKEERGQMQRAWEIRVAGSREKLVSGKADLWNSGKIRSDESINIRYGGKRLTSRQDCWWQVRVWDQKNRRSDWSEPAFWGTGILDPSEWKAQWIGAPWQGELPLPRASGSKKPGQSVSPYNSPAEKLPPPAPLLRKTFNVSKKIVSARAYVTGLGYFELYVNGVKAGDDVLVPNLTLYGKRDDIGEIGAMTKNNFNEYRVMYLCYEIGPMMKSGENVIGAILGNGFYNPASHWCQGYGTPRFLGQIYIRYSDGTEEIITSDETWKASGSPIIMDLVYDGEHYDARLEQEGWCTPGFNDTGWEKVVIRKPPEGKMKAHMSPTDKVMERLAPEKITKLGEGHYRVDFGQEISGWLHLIDINGNKGERIEIRYICESHVGDNSYTLKGGGNESYKARFTWFVFREVEIINWPGELKQDNLSAEAVYSDVETTGRFECSNSLFNNINRIWWRSQTDNMHGGIASDCPHRERSAYTGDGQVACVTVMHNFDARAFYNKWIQDINGARNPENGYVPNGAPWQPGCGGGVAWGAAMNIMPWEFYLHYGDTSILRNNYEGMKGYIRYMLTWTDGDGIMYSRAPDKAKPNRWINLGEWVAPGNLPPDDMVHTFFLWRCSDISADAAKVLGHEQDQIFFSELAERTRIAFQVRFFDNEKGTYGAAGGNIFALKMGIPDSQKDRVLNALKSDIAANNYHLDTGIFGTQFLFEVLSENGLHELAYKIMNQRTQPSYGWWIEQGATTTWEKWDGTNSRNHPMFGGGITWFYRILAGMIADPENPGYRHIIFRPQPAADLSFVSYSSMTPYGESGIRWSKENNRLIIRVKVPVGSTASVYIPARTAENVKEGDRRIRNSKNITLAGVEEGHSVFRVSSGNYTFETALTE